jgi:phage gp16-like protein
MENPKPKRDMRGSDLAKIHIAKKALGLDDEAYRDVLRAVCKVESSKQLDMQGRWKLLAYFRSKGWKPEAAAEKSGKRVWKPDAGSQASKILALWLELKRNGKLDKATDEALFAFCKKMSGVERPDWLTAAQANDVIEGLKSWLAR